MNKNLKLAGAVIGLVLACLYMVLAWKSYQPGASGNNGVTSEFPVPSEAAQKRMQAMMQRGPAFDPAKMRDPAEREKMREQFEKEIPPAEREEMKKMGEEMRARIQRAQSALSPQDQQRMFEKMRERFARGGFGGRGPGGRGPGGRGPGGQGGPPPAGANP